MDLSLKIDFFEQEDSTKIIFEFYYNTMLVGIFTIKNLKTPKKFVKFLNKVLLGKDCIFEISSDDIGDNHSIEYNGSLFTFISSDTNVHFRMVISHDEDIVDSLEKLKTYLLSDEEEKINIVREKFFIDYLENIETISNKSKFKLNDHINTEWSKSYKNPNRGT